MNRLVLLAAICCACSSSELVFGDACSRDDQCDPGDSCKGNACRPETANTFAGTGIAVTPSDTSVHERTGVTPPRVLLQGPSADGAAHDFTVACSPRATPIPASGTVSGSAPVNVQIQPPSSGVAGTHIETCTFQSTSAPTVSARLTVSAAGFPGLGGGGGAPIRPTRGTLDLLHLVITGGTPPRAGNDTA